VKKLIYNILMVGVGGQGIILASDILTLAAMYCGYDAKKSEIHGMSQRGGAVFSHIRFGKRVYSPLISEGEADILFSLEEMETLRWLNYANTESLIITLPIGIREELKKKCDQIKFLDPEDLRKKIDNIKFFNVALLGVLSNYVDFSEKAWKRAIEEEVPKGSFEGNWNAFLIGKSIKSF